MVNIILIKDYKKSPEGLSEHFFVKIFLCELFLYKEIKKFLDKKEVQTDSKHPKVKHFPLSTDTGRGSRSSGVVSVGRFIIIIYVVISIILIVINIIIILIFIVTKIITINLTIIMAIIIKIITKIVIILFNKSD